MGAGAARTGHRAGHRAGDAGRAEAPAVADVDRGRTARAGGHGAANRTPGADEKRTAHRAQKRRLQHRHRKHGGIHRRPRPRERYREPHADDEGRQGKSRCWPLLRRPPENGDAGAATGWRYRRRRAVGILHPPGERGGRPGDDHARRSDGEIIGNPRATHPRPRGQPQKKLYHRRKNTQLYPQRHLRNGAQPGQRRQPATPARRRELGRNRPCAAVRRTDRRRLAGGASHLGLLRDLPPGDCRQRAAGERRRAAMGRADPVHGAQRRRANRGDARRLLPDPLRHPGIGARRRR